VCLLWRHPLVATEFRARLAGEPFDVADFRIKGDSAPLDLIPPDAGLVVVDSEDGSALPVLAALEALRPSAVTGVLAENFENEEVAFRLLRSGVKALVTYAELRAQLPRALESVAAGGFWVPRALLSRFVEVTVQNTVRQRPTSPAALTPREGEIFEDLLQNLSNKEIAQRRRLTSRTIKFHVSNVLAKYGVKRRADLLLLSFPQH
jgi:DNA-binding NarL/FixJ family response regulator